MAGKETIQSFRQGHGVFVPGPTPILLYSLPHATPPALPLTTALVVSEGGLLQNYVQEVSDLMWDVLEMTERELWLQVPGGRNVPEWMLQADGSLIIHWARNAPMHQFVHATGKPAVAYWLPTTKDEQDSVLAPLENVVTLPPSKESSPQFRYMRLEPNGAVQILK